MEPISATFDLSTLTGKSALITGGASGIGLAVARTWAEAGVYVTIADIQPSSQGEELAAELHANYIYCDVTDWQSQIAAFKSAISFSPRQTLDIVATFAGTAFAPINQVDQVLMAGEPSLDTDPGPPIIRNIEVNLIGTYYTSWLALYYFRLPPPSPIKSEPSAYGMNGKLRDRSLIYVASIGAYMDSPKASTYPASKFGVRGLFRSTRARTQELGVRCNLLAPWFVDTPLVAPVKKAMQQKGLDMAKTLQFASLDACVEAANICATVTEYHGRALAIQPEGIFDLKDDLENGWAGDQLRPIMKRRREAGFNP